MNLLAREKETICALSSALGHCGVSIIRVCGQRALVYARQLCSFLPEKPESHRVYFGSFKTPRTNEVIDQVLVTYFADGHSFTGEETLEISCHGNPLIVDEVLSSFIQIGCLQAQPGEFTFRAFMNGKLDLIQAESVLEIINATSKTAQRIGISHLQGDLTKRLGEIKSEITKILATLEASIDFSTEDIEITSSLALSTKLLAVENVISEIVGTYEAGEKLVHGIRIALLGAPNVGKSSLFNRLLEKDRAIVSALPGTTRDTVEGQRIFDGKLVHLIDTAGLRDAPDEIEKLGVGRSIAEIENADVILLVVDSPKIDWEFQNQDRTLPVINKSDVLSPQIISQIQKTLREKKFREPIVVSAKSGEGLGALQDAIKKIIVSPTLESTLLLTNPRHFEGFSRALKSVREAGRLLSENASPEFAALSLQESLAALMELTGEHFDDQVMDRVFKEFCIGK